MRIEVLTSISGVDFETCFLNRVDDEIDGVPISLIGLTQLKQNKRASGRHKDLADLKSLPYPACSRFLSDVYESTHGPRKSLQSDFAADYLGSMDRGGSLQATLPSTMKDYASDQICTFWTQSR